MNKVCRSLCLLSAVLVLLSIQSLANAFNLPDSGQTLCYDAAAVVRDCDSTGQDGEYSINPMSFNDNGNGTVTDNNTGLMWQKCTVGQTNYTDCSGSDLTYNWYEATGTADSLYNPSGGTNACGSLNTSNFGGHNDWRLPAKKELITIEDYSILNPNPSIKTAYFPNTNRSGYWSSTAFAGNPGSAWRADFNASNVSSGNKFDSYYVRCVRGGQTIQRLTDNLDHTVTAARTGLMWQQDEGGNMSWSAALGYCNALHLPPTDGYTDWRLPNVKELESLTDDSLVNPMIDGTKFPGAHASNYWSATADSNGPSSAWTVSFSDGYVGNSSKGNNYYVRCLRGAQYESSYVRIMRVYTPVNTYNNIQDAYNNAQAGDVIQAKDVVSTENQTFVAAKAVFLKGGYDSGFTSNSGFTTISDNLTIIGGTVTIDKLIIK